LVRRVEVFNFQNLIIENAKVSNIPLIQNKKIEKDVLTLIIIRNPYTYFDYLLFDYLAQKRSILFTEDIMKQMEMLDNHDFLKWFKTLNFIPFYNPQTFQLDVRKRLDVAIGNLESFDYVVPYEELDTFLANILLGLNISKKNEGEISFSLSSIKNNELTKEFIEKDVELYSKAQELWNLIKKNDFKPLRDHIKGKPTYIKMDEVEYFQGVVGLIDETLIRGFAFNSESQESLSLEIYKNNKLLRTIKADIIRKDLIKQFNLSHGKCGFQVNFEKPTFKKGDTIDIIIVPENIRLPIVGNAKKFLEE